MTLGTLAQTLIYTPASVPRAVETPSDWIRKESLREFTADEMLDGDNMYEARSVAFGWPWVKIPYPPVNIPIPTKIGSKMGW